MRNRTWLRNDRPESLWQTVRGDFASAAGWRVLAVAVVLAWMAFQWGLGNDILLPSIAATAFDGVDDGTTWSRGIAGVSAAAGAGFAFWALTQLIDVVVVMTGLRLLPGITDRLSRFLRRKGWVTSYEDMKWSTRWIIAYASGASLLCLVDVLATGRQGLGPRKTMAGSAILLSAGSVGVVVALVAAAAMIGKRIPATTDEAEAFVRYARNPLMWIAVFVVVFLVSQLSSGRGQSPTTSDPD